MQHDYKIFNPPPPLGHGLLAPAKNSILPSTITVNCGAPLDESARSVMIMGYNGVALEGDSVSFACSSGLVLSGPNSSTCTGNGKWEPDPRELACKGDDTCK